MSDLRERCIEAMNEELDAMSAESNVGWNPNTAPLLDAVLDVLEESADQWVDYSENADPIVVERIKAHLRRGGKMSKPAKPTRAEIDAVEDFHYEYRQESVDVASALDPPDSRPPLITIYRRIVSDWEVVSEDE